VTFFRYLAFVTLALWIGGLVALGVAVAPTLFDVLSAQDAVGGRELAGTLFGRVLDAFQYYAWFFAALLLASLGGRAALGPRPRRFAVRMWTVSAMLACSLVTSFYVTPRIDTIRKDATPSVSSLADTDPRKVQFGRLHGAASAMMLLTVIAGLGLIWGEMRDTNG
jgi:hypothetical protein